MIEHNPWLTLVLHVCGKLPVNWLLPSSKTCNCINSYRQELTDIAAKGESNIQKALTQSVTSWLLIPPGPRSCCSDKEIP